MTAATHDLVAFAALITSAALFPPQSLNTTTAFVCLVSCVVGALIPDLDQATNRLWDLLPAGNFIGKIFRNLFLHHRTLSHSILGIYLFHLLFTFVLPKILNPSMVDISLVYYSLMIGLISHIAGDMLTKEGVPFLFPFSFKIGFPPIKALRITTGKFFEKFIILPSLTVYIIWFVISKKEIFLNLMSLIRS
jgi:inner membrane protein